MLMTQKLAIHLKLEDNVSDSSGLGNNGTIFGAVSYGTGADIMHPGSNRALVLSNTAGTSNFVRVAEPVSSRGEGISFDQVDIIRNTKSFTVSCWVKPQWVQSFEMYVSTTCPGNGWYLARWGTSANQAVFNINGGAVGTVDPLNDGQWHMVTAVVNTETNRQAVYCDGSLQGQGDAYPNPGYDFLVGALNWSSPSSPSFDLGYTGLIDDVRYYNYALADTDIMQLYADFRGPFCPKNSNPIAGDLNKDCGVDFEDMAVMAASWLNCNRYPVAVCE
jgi:hypothetical protein